MSVTKEAMVGARAIASTKWVVLSEVVAKASAPFIAIVLARLLSPEDYGLVAIAAITNTFAAMFWDAGLSRALIQAKELTAAMTASAFWLNVISAGLLFGLTLLGADLIARLLNAPSAGPVVRVMAVGMLLAALVSVPMALLTRALEFRLLFWLRMCGALVPILVTIPLAWAGFRVWALVSGTLTGQALSLGLVWAFSRWRPWHGFERATALRMCRKSVWYFGESLVAWSFCQGDAFIVGTFLNPHDLGLYRVARSLVELFFNTCLNPILQIAYPAFSRLQHDRSSLTDAFQRVNRLVLVVVCPSAVGLLLLGPSLVDLLYGSKWEGLSSVVGILTVWAAMGWMVGLNADVYRALGRPDLMAILNACILTYCLPVFILTAREGVQTFALGRLGLTLITLPLHIFLACRFLGLPATYLWSQGRSSILASIFMAAMILALDWISGRSIAAPRAWWLLGVQSVAAVGVFVGGLTLLDRRFAAELFRWLRRALGKS